MAETARGTAAESGRDEGRRAFDGRLGSSWVLRWDTVLEARPRVLHVPKPAGDATLFRAPSGDLVVFDGYLFDRAAGEAGPPVSDAALVASAYERWRDGLFEKISGGFAVVIWDEGRRRLTVGRDAMGRNPCFYWWNGRVFLIATSLDAIIGRREVAGTFNRAFIAEYLQDSSLSHQIHETFYEDVRRLPPCPHAPPGRRDDRGLPLLGSGPAGLRLGNPGGDLALRIFAGAGGEPVPVRGRRQHRLERRLRLGEYRRPGRRTAPRGSSTSRGLASLREHRVRRG